MERRSVLYAVGGATTAGIAGFAGYRFVSGPPTPSQVRDVEFEVTDDRADPAFPGEGEGPDVTVERDRNRVEITGAFVVGNTCHEARLDRIEYETDREAELVATVEGHEPFSILRRGCEDVAVTQAYRLTFHVDPLPDRITGIEREPHGDEYSTTEAV